VWLLRPCLEVSGDEDSLHDSSDLVVARGRRCPHLRRPRRQGVPAVGVAHQPSPADPRLTFEPGPINRKARCFSRDLNSRVSVPRDCGLTDRPNSPFQCVSTAGFEFLLRHDRTPGVDTCGGGETAKAAHPHKTSGHSPSRCGQVGRSTPKRLGLCAPKIMVSNNQRKFAKWGWQDHSLDLPSPSVEEVHRNKGAPILQQGGKKWN
jgi:hypothetical protein